MKITKEQVLEFGLAYMKECTKLMRAMSEDKDRLIRVMREFDITEGFNFTKFARQAIMDHIQTYHDEEIAVDLTKDIIG